MLNKKYQKIFIGMVGNIKKFSFGEMTSNNNGKTSVTSTMGFYIITIGGLGFILGCIDKMFISHGIDVINQSIMFVTIGAALLGIKNVVHGKPPASLPEENIDETEEVK